MRNTVELSLEERRREFATAGALGATPRHLFVGLVAEGAMVGPLGGVVAMLAGTFVARAFINALSDELSKATGLSVSTSSPWWVVVVALAGGVTLSVLAALRPARNATRLDLVAELTDRARFADSDERRSYRGYLLTAIALVACLVLGAAGHAGGGTEKWQPSASVAALVGTFVVLFAGCAQLTPLLLAQLQRAPGFSTGPMRVALTNILSARRRTVAVVIAITAPVAVTTVFGGVVPGMREGAARFARESGADRVWVSTLGTNNTTGIDSRTTPAIEAALRAFPGVAAIEHNYFVGYDTER
ncbi:MAG: ABC transporter permease, partial [Acidimicrobiales bacterium]|nr:ABC transporter permease [Acidimicrobiales bacterium]